MKEIKNIGQFDGFIREIMNDILRITEKIQECKYIPKGMEQVMDSLTDAGLDAYLCLSDNAEEMKY